MRKNADLILRNGVIYTADSREMSYEAVAIRDKKIIVVGSNDEVKKWADENTQIINLDGKFVMPGIFDAHNHLPLGAITHTEEIELTSYVNKEDILKEIERYVKDNPNNEYYVGLGFGRTYFDDLGPKKEWLDEICCDKPMWIIDQGGHSCWLNTKAFENAGITKDTPNPLGGVFKKHPETGELTGLVIEDPAITYAKRNVPKYSKEQYKKAILWAQEFFNSEGVTAMYDASLYENEPGIYNAYNELAQEGNLTMRVRAGWYISEPKDEKEMDRFLENTSKLNETFDTPYFKPNSVKILRDGTYEDQTAYMSEPYLNGEEGNCGEPTITKENFEMMLDKLDERRIQVHIHQIGDAVASEALDKFEEMAECRGRWDSRNTFAHVQYLKKDYIRRMGNLGMTAATSPNWAVLSPDVHYSVYLPAVGEERTTHLYQINSLQRAGVTVGYHTDYYVSEPDLGGALYSAITRAYPKKQFEYYYSESGYEQNSICKFPQEEHISSPLPPYDETISLAEAIKLMTYNGAYLNFMEDEIGSIEVGKYADMIVLESNPFELIVKDMEKIADLKPIMTIFDGKIVYEKSK